MQKIIYTTKYYCELCKKEQSVNLYGDEDSIFTKNEEPELIEWAKHFHWVENHRVCAICGLYVASEELALADYSKNIRVHNNYNDEYEKVKRGDYIEKLLIVHEKCLKDNNA